MRVLTLSSEIVTYPLRYSSELLYALILISSSSVDTERKSGLYVCCALFGNTNAIPGLIVVGSFTVPLSGLVLFLEVNAYRNISLYDIALIFLVGGCASLVATLFLFSIVGVSELDFIGSLLVGIIEEVGKAVIIYYYIAMDAATVGIHYLV